MRPRCIWIASAAALVLVAGDAQALQRPGVRALDALYQRSLDLTQSLTEAAAGGAAQLNASGDSQALDCLETLREAASEVSGQLMDVRDVASLAASLHRGADRRLGVAATRRAVAGALTVLPVERRQVTQTASLCSAQAAVGPKAADATKLIDDATAALEKLQGHSPTR
jgi:hypothetical protein